MEKDTKTIQLRPPVWALVVATIVASVLIIYLIALARNEFKKYRYIGRTDQQIYSITISGEGKVTAKPDIGQISLGVQTEKLKVVDAQKENTDKVNALTKALKDFGIKDEDIQTLQYTIYPQYEWTNNKQQLKGYNVNQTVAVKVRDLDKIGPIIESAGRIGVNQIGDLNFTIDDPEKLRQQAREKALDNAKQKAEALAKIAGSRLGKVISFSEDNVGGGPYPMYKDLSLDIGGRGGAESAPAIQPGSQDIIINATVTYELL